MNEETDQDDSDTETLPDAPRRRGIYLLPNLFTTAGLFAGFYAIVAAMNGRYTAAAVAIYVAMVMDMLDGRVARMTSTQSDFGKEYDSLSDMASFGLAPALVVYEWALSKMGEMGWAWAKLGWLAAFIYVAGAALRLARFNSRHDTADKRYFQGLASPAAAALVAGLVWVCDDLNIKGTQMLLLSFVLTLASGSLMVSNVRYYSFKDIDLRNRVPFFVMLLVVLVFVFTSIDPPKVLFTVALVYALSGPVQGILALRKARAARKSQP